MLIRRGFSHHNSTLLLYDFKSYIIVTTPGREGACIENIVNSVTIDSNEETKRKI